MSLYMSICAVLAVICGMAGSIRQLQMLQQNSYFLKRYIKWLAGDSSRFIYLQSGACVLLSLLLLLKQYIAATVCFAAFTAVCVYLCIINQKRAVKKLVFTKRIIRACAVSAVLLCALASVCVFMHGSALVVPALPVLFVLSFFPELLTLVTGAVMLPFERMITNGYIKDAKRILAQHKNLTVIGVTGSYGKTSVKFILARLLSEKFNVVATPQSFNTPMGVVRTVREKLRPQTQIFVCEMGAKNIGDIKEICDIVNPKIGIITSVGEQHLETFKTIENVCRTKFELYDACFKNRGTVFANGDSAPVRARFDAGDDIHLYCSSGTGEYRADNVRCDKNGTAFDLVLGGDTVPVTTRLLGMHSVVNITGAAAVAYHLGVSAGDIAFAVSQLEPAEHRLQLKSFTNGSVMIDDAYNSNPEGCLEAVRVLSSFDGMKKVIVTPGLVELGDREYSCNYELGRAAAECLDVIILVGRQRSIPLAAAAGDAGFPEDRLYIVDSFAAAMEIYNTLADKNTVVLLENDLPDNYLK